MPSETSFRVSKRVVCEFVAFSILVSATSAVVTADEPSRLGRLFRFGSGSSRSAPSQRPSQPTIESIAPSAPTLTPIPTSPGDSSTTILEPIAPSSRDEQRILPKARPGRAITMADPLITRIAIGRSTDGRQFGMFLQVFEDGTILDSEGVHSLGPDSVRPIAESIATGEVFRIKGHCGNASTDFVENVQLIVYERRFGTLKANSISFSGNGEGCDHAVKHLQVLLDGIQNKLTAPSGKLTQPEAAAEPAPAPEAPLPLILGPN